MKLIIFYADWCGPCKIYKPIYGEIARSNDIELIRVNIEDEESMIKWDKYDIRSVPTTIIMDGNKIINQFSGLITKNSLQKEINNE